MANNIISDWLETYALYSDTPEQEAATRYAAQLNRLVEAAREAKKILNHDNGTTHDAAERYGCAAELTAALRDIELPSEVK